MSGRFNGSSVCSLDADDLEEIRERLNELTREKENLGGSKSESFELIRKLESHVKTLSKSHDEDKKRIADLERKQLSCCGEIDSLQDQLSKKNSDLNHLAEKLCCFQIKIENMKYLCAELEMLREKVSALEYERSLLMQEMACKEDLIVNLTSRKEKLEESISFMALEYECEMESKKLESTSVNQSLYETKKKLEEITEENLRMSTLIQDLELQICIRNKLIENLSKESEDLKEKLRMSDMTAVAFARKVEEQFHESLLKSEKSALCKLDDDMRSYGNILGPLLSKFFSMTKSSDANLQRKIHDYEHLVVQLKEEMRLERLKAKEEAEELAQEMAELRYRLTSMINEECKRRAGIEQISLQRIAELEAVIAEEREKSMDPQEQDSFANNP